MPIRPSFKLEPSDQHGLVGVERVGNGGVQIESFDIAGLPADEDSVMLSLTHEEAVELSAMLRAVIGTATEDERAMLTAASEPMRPPTPLGESIIATANQHHDD